MRRHNIDFSPDRRELIAYSEGVERLPRAVFPDATSAAPAGDAMQLAAAFPKRSLAREEPRNTSFTKISGSKTKAGYGDIPLLKRLPSIQQTYVWHGNMASSDIHSASGRSGRIASIAFYQNFK
ncbi:hypothetical protein Aduo_012625 [Ancylostoma duodenale]